MHIKTDVSAYVIFKIEKKKTVKFYILQLLTF